ncbi:LysE family translocator [Novosphingobium sediminicola]|uniref:Threonine/homoserine/homoserine lactone efflux protein n=1 Tax=Novosphingobium sediminicola TaxID=563162 RepID=A0A7W6CQR3_9SPHN|nr:LysE family translocator [Novosphingobium sediminicola]MBB3955957.1 threonine/homoserine/homoserine lactone efflux protein [Novosphingobium sediminicola]
MTINWFEFAIAVLVIELTPGPNMAWLAALSLAEGRRAGWVATAGIGIGLALNAMLAALGLVELLSVRPGLQSGLRWAGVALMLWLAWQAWREADMVAKATEPQGAGRHFVSGLLVNLFNPKALLFFVVVVPPFLGGAAPSIPQAMGFAAISVGLATAVHLAIVAGGAKAHGLISNPRRMQKIRRVMALIMLGIALWLAGSAL